jgi:hypothetical protein
VDFRFNKTQVVRGATECFAKRSTLPVLAFVQTKISSGVKKNCRFISAINAALVHIKSSPPRTAPSGQTAIVCTKGFATIVRRRKSNAHQEASIPATKPLRDPLCAAAGGSAKT